MRMHLDFIFSKVVYSFFVINTAVAGMASIVWRSLQLPNQGSHPILHLPCFSNGSFALTQN